MHPSPTPVRLLTPAWAVGLTVMALIWAYSYLAIDLATSSSPEQPDLAALDALQLTFWRLALAAPLYLPILIAEGRRGNLPPPRYLWINLGLGAFFFAGIVFLFNWSMDYGNLLINGLLGGLMPVTVVLVAVLYGDRIDRRAWLWIAVAFVGTLILFLSDLPKTPLELDEAVYAPIWPAMVMLLATIGVGFYSIWSRGYADRWPSHVINGLNLLGGAVASLLAMLLFRVPWLPTEPLAPAVIPNVLFLGLIASCILPWLWLLALTRVPVHQASVFTYLEPLGVAALYFMVGEKEPPTLLTAIGGLVILFGAFKVGMLREPTVAATPVTYPPPP